MAGRGRTCCVRLGIESESFFAHASWHSALGMFGKLQLFGRSWVLLLMAEISEQPATPTSFDEKHIACSPSLSQSGLEVKQLGCHGCLSLPLMEVWKEEPGCACESSCAQL